MSPCLSDSYTLIRAHKVHRIGATESWNGQYTVDCTCVAALPELTFNFGGQPFTLRGEDYILHVGDTCVSSFTGIDIPAPIGPLWIIGDSALRRWYTVYDLGTNAVGFGLAR